VLELLSGERGRHGHQHNGLSNRSPSIAVERQRLVEASQGTAKRHCPLSPTEGYTVSGCGRWRGASVMASIVDSALHRRQGGTKTEVAVA
jgi:hypothetical protein